MLSNLPGELTSFVGRRAEIASTAELLTSHRLLSLVGPGGVGKTRLATQVASSSVDAYGEGAWFIDLSRTSDVDVVPSVFAEPFSVGDVATASDRPMTEVLADYLAPRHLLLVVDNCEHVLSALRPLVSTLLLRCPEIVVLATSRQTLDIEGEVVFRVAPLAVTEVAAGTRPDAISLFLERAAQVDASHQPDEAEMSAIREIVLRLDGLPLAIELAASRTKLLSPAQILDRLSDRFRFLQQDTPRGGRHETLRTAMEWSYELLDEAEKDALHRLAVFNGWSLEAAEHVMGGSGVFGLLGGLVDKSLVEVVTRGRDNRYRLLETVRQYALERLAESGAEQEARVAHAGFFLGLTEVSDTALRSSDQAEWIEHIKAEHDNIRTALGWSLQTGRIELALRFVAAMGRFWFMQTHWKDALWWFKRVTEEGGDNHDLLWARSFIKTGAIELITRGRPSDPEAAEKAHRILSKKAISARWPWPPTRSPRCAPETPRR